MDVLTDTESQQTVQQGAEEMGERQQVPVAQLAQFVYRNVTAICKQVQVSCLLRMEDDDDTTVDILSSDGDSWPGILMLGDVYAGHKQVTLFLFSSLIIIHSMTFLFLCTYQAKRYWLINDSELFSIEIVVKPEVDKRIHLIDGEVRRLAYFRLSMC